MDMHYPRLTSLDFLEVCLPATAAFYRYWDSKRQGRAMPARSDLDPIEMRPWLPGIILVDVLRNPYRLVYRLVGTRSVDIRSSEVTGRTVQEGGHGSKLAHVMENYRLAIDERTLVYDWDGTASRDGGEISTEVLMLPLSSDGASVDRVISYIDDRPLFTPTYSASGVKKIT
jgi:hypothetical protein